MSQNVEATTLVPHGLIFLCDPTAIIDVPADTSAAPVLSTANCASLWTVHEVDGPTTLVLCETYDGDDCKLIFQGSLTATGRKLGFSTSSGERIIEVDLDDEVAEVTVYSNDPSEPTKIVCVAAPLRP
jgi:hypothetical protein